MAVELYDQTYKKYKGQSRVSMRFYKGTGFLGDIGQLSFDLSSYGDLSGNKSVAVFAKSPNKQVSIDPVFSNLRIWKNYLSFD